MLEIIKFNDQSAFWTKYRNINERFVDATIDYIRDRLHHIGYIYLNEVYQAFGVAWNPKEENHCIVFTADKDIPRFSYMRVDDVDFKICMYW